MPRSSRRRKKHRPAPQAGPVAWLLVPLGTGTGGVGVEEVRALLAKVFSTSVVGRRPGILAMGDKKPGRRAPAPKPRPPGERREWADYPAASRRRAEKRRNVIAAFFTARENGSTVGQASLAARQLHLRELNRDINPRTLTRWRRRVEALGGIEKATLESFLDSKACPHPKNRKPKKK